MKKRKKKNHLLLIISTGIFLLALIGFVLYYYLVYVPYVTDYESSPSLCKTIKVSDENGINLVFFSNKDNAIKYSDYLFSVSPLSSIKDKFNIYYVDNYIPKCDIYRGVAILCYSKELLRKAAVCPNDYVIVLQEKEGEIRSSSYLNVLSVNTVHPLSVIVHEFGHSFANLAEEYIPGKIPRGSKNCKSSCDKFDSETDGCFLECSEGDYFRSIENGVMRTLQTSKLGIFNEKLFIDSFNEQYTESGSVLTGEAIGDLSTDCQNQISYIAVQDPISGNITGKQKIIGCASEFKSTVDSGKIFTDGWDNKTEITVPSSGEIKGEVQLITGKTYENVDVPVVRVISEEVVSAEENKTLELTIITKEITTDIDPRTGETTEVVKEVSVVQPADFSNLPEPEPEVEKKEGIFADSADAIKYFIENIDLSPEAKELRSETPSDEIFDMLLNNSNSTWNNETNSTFGDFNVTETNVTGNSTNSTIIPEDETGTKLTGKVIAELNSEKKYWIILLVAFISLFIYLHFKRKR